MDFKFYKEVLIELPDGNKYDVYPVTVEDMPIVLEFLSKRVALTKANNKAIVKDKAKRGRKPKKEKMEAKKDTEATIDIDNGEELSDAQKTIGILFPLANTIAQRNIKRHNPENMNLSVSELDEIPDTILPTNLAMKICIESINLSMSGEDDTKNPELSQEAIEKSLEESGEPDSS